MAIGLAIYGRCTHLRLDELVVQQRVDVVRAAQHKGARGLVGQELEHRLRERRERAVTGIIRGGAAAGSV
jgi:hypothetical protein